MSFKYCFKSLIIISFLLGSISCKKNQEKVKDIEEIVSPTTGNKTEFILDSIYLYASQVYLWNEALPSYADFNPRKQYGGLTPELSAFKREMFAISQFKKNPLSGNPYEYSLVEGIPKYSFIKYGRTISNSLASTLQSDEKSLIKSSLITDNEKVIAYVSLNSFPALSSSKPVLDKVFEDFAIAKPRYIIIDLRSNNGGYIETAEYMFNLIVPSTLNGKLMYTEQFNSKMQSGKASILKYQPYLNGNGKPISYNGRNATLADVDYTESGNTYRINKKGKLETIENIYFIVSDKTASASEMLISCLKPYINLKLVGSRTFGKPVGFFAININQYSVFLSSFLLKNAQGWYGYFDGMEPNILVKDVDVPELGNVNELCLKAAIADISNNKPAKKLQLPKINSLQSSSIKITNYTFEDIGMVENRLRLR